jgi:hypothetical protein
VKFVGKVEKMSTIEAVPGEEVKETGEGELMGRVFFDFLEIFSGFLEFSSLSIEFPLTFLTFPPLKSSTDDRPVSPPKEIIRYSLSTLLSLRSSKLSQAKPPCKNSDLSCMAHHKPPPKMLNASCKWLPLTCLLFPSTDLLPTSPSRHQHDAEVRTEPDAEPWRGVNFAALLPLQLVLVIEFIISEALPGQWTRPGA